MFFFGFGDNELLPFLTRDEIDGAPFQKIRMKGLDTTDLTNDDAPAVMIPFADREVMTSFMEGMTKEMRDTCASLIARTAVQISERVIRDNFSLTEDEFATVQAMNKPTIKDLVQEALKALKAQIQIKNINPVMDVIGSLPKEDMAKLAEALIEVTALKKKVSLDIETVGGPIYVCVVTKGDGFIWIKRKHYFDIALNMHYLNRRSVPAGQVFLNGGGHEK